MISVLIVDDSPTILQYLKALVEGEPELMVVGTAVNGLEAVNQVKRLKPDVVIMDIEMPELDGIAATQRIMAEHPVPIVICSANLDRGVTEKTYRAIEAGALAAVAKPKGIGALGAPEMIKSLLRKVRLMAAVKVVRRTRVAGSPSLGQSPTPTINESLLSKTSLSSREFLPSTSFLQDLKNNPPALVAIGASTGGPMALMSILAKLSPSFSLPILVVQHISQGFLEGMLNWMQGQAALPLAIAVHGEKPLGGHVYFAPDGYHLELSTSGCLCLSGTPPEYNVRPAVAALFRSLDCLAAPSTLGIILTGMGRDGASELLAMRKRGHLTMAQDEESSIVNGMPGEAARLGATQIRLPPAKIAEVLNLL